jgi:hypothetical protein
MIAKFQCAYIKIGITDGHRRDSSEPALGYSYNILTVCHCYSEWCSTKLVFSEVSFNSRINPLTVPFGVAPCIAYALSINGARSYAIAILYVKL